MALSRKKLGERLVDALEASGVPVSVKTGLDERPLLLDVRMGVAPLRLRVFLWRITHGGTKRSPSEYRVQTTRPQKQRFLIEEGPQTLLLGHHESLDVFAAWDVRRHPDPGSSSSLQVSLETLEEAGVTGFTSAPRETDSGPESVMAFRPDSMAAYLEVADRLYVAGVDSAAPAVEAATSGAAITDDALRLGIAPERQREIRMIAAIVRDRRFRTVILRAYNERCAFCGLDLGIVEAAHIQGVADEGPDVLTNGIAACPNHHKLFDRGLLLVEDDGRISVNHGRAAALGIDLKDRARLGEGLWDRLWLPSDPAMRPEPARLEHHRSKWAPSG